MWIFKLPLKFWFFFPLISAAYLLVCIFTGHVNASWVQNLRSFVIFSNSLLENQILRANLLLISINNILISMRLEWIVDEWGVHDNAVYRNEIHLVAPCSQDNLEGRTKGLLDESYRKVAFWHKTKQGFIIV